MKVKKLLACLSASAMAASMMSMVSFADDVAEPQFGAQFYVQAYDGDTWAWNTWKQVDSSAVDGVVTLSGDADELAGSAFSDGITAGVDEDKVTLAGSGLQFYVGNTADYEVGTVIKATVNYTVQAADDDDNKYQGEVSFQAEVTQNPWGEGLIANQSMTMFSDWGDLDKLGEFTATISFSDVEVIPYEAPVVESSYNTADAVTSSTYGGDWGSAGLYTPDFDHIVAEDGMLITVEYSLVPDSEGPKTDEETGEKYWDQHAFAAMDQHGWVKLGDEWEFTQSGWELDPQITVATKTEKEEGFDEERDAAPGPFMKKDGFLLVKEDGKVQFKLNQGMVEELIAYAQDNPGNDGGIWYGLGFQVYGVVLNQVTYEYNVEGVESPKKFSVGKGVSFNNSVTVDPAEYGVRDDAGFSKIKIGLLGISAADKSEDPENYEGSAWNDWCTYKIRIEHADGSVDWVAVIGAQVAWDTTVDDNGTVEDDTDDIKFTPDECVKADENGKAQVELDYNAGDVYTVMALGWDSYPDDPYINVVGVAFDDEEIDWPAAPGGDDSSEDESSEDESSEDESTEEESSKPGTTGNNGGSNANTGAVALGLGVLALAGAAVVVTKKKF